MTSKELVRRVFSQADMPRIPFIPWVFSHAARLEQISLREMFADPGRLARALQNARSLYGYDAVANVFDHALEAEACGCTVVWSAEDDVSPVSYPSPSYDITKLDVSTLQRNGRLPVVLEATKRLKVVLGRTVAVAAVVTGPFALADRLVDEGRGERLRVNFEQAKILVEFAGQVALRVCKMYCELEPDVVVIAEDSLPRLPIKYFALAQSVLRPIWNTVRFHNAHTLLLLRGCTTDNLKQLCDLGADSIVASGEMDFSYLRKAVSELDLVLGGAIPCSRLVGSQQELADYVSKCIAEAPSIRYLTTEWEVPAGTPVENMHEVMKIITGG